MNSEEAVVDTLYLKDDGIIPNNPILPVLLYRHVWATQPVEAEHLLNRNGWGNSWTNGVFDFHHYHSNTHEALAVIQGSAKLLLGGEHGQPVLVEAGDVIVLPAGTGHKRMEKSPDFRIVGAYPEGMNYNLKTGERSERPAVLHEIREVPLPLTDPVYGSGGPLVEHWGKLRG